MSIEALSWAFNLELPSSGVKLTLLALANYASESGEAFPSQKEMSKKTCLCERAIRTHLVTLEDLGLISRVGRTRANGSFTTDLFQLNIGSLPIGKICQRQNMPAAENDISQRQILPNPAANSAAPESSLNTTVTKKNLKTVGALATRLPADWEIPDAYVDFCKTERPDLNVQFVADDFRDYWISQPDVKGKKLDWAATWRRWVRNQRRQPMTANTTNNERDRIAAEIWGNQNGRSQGNAEINGIAERVG